MGQNAFAEALVEIMLSWVRLVVNWFWSLTQADVTRGLLGWFTHSWPVIVVLLVIAGAVVDWLVWMIRWRPYWLWFRKKQIIYGDAPRPQAQTPRFQSVRDPSAADYDDPFAELSEQEAASAEPDYQEDPFSEPEPAVPERPLRRPGRRMPEMTPVVEESYDRARYERPALGENKKVRELTRARPVLTNKGRRFDVEEWEPDKDTDRALR